jgi:phi13 family phage major tail protein
VSVEAAQLTADMRQGMLGHTVASSTYTVTDAASPFVGVGFCLKNRYKGSVTYRCYWYHKVQFSEGQRSFNTKGENLEFQTEFLNGTAVGVQLTSGGAAIYYATKRADTETAARTWLNGKAGIT